MARETDLFWEVREAYKWAKKHGKMNVHLRVAEASRLGRGVRLSAEEVDELIFRDEAFVAAALSEPLEHGVFDSDA